MTTNTRPLARLAVAVSVVTTAAAATGRADVPAANDPRPTPVTVHLHDVPFTDATAAIGKQAGVQVDYEEGGGSWPHVTVDADAAPFWQVLCDAAAQAHAAVAPLHAYGTAANVIVLEPVGTAGRAGRPVVGGPVLASFAQVEHLAQLTAAPAHVDFCELAVDVMWEPRLNVAYYEAQGRPDEATDENGRSLVPADDAAADGDPRNPNNYHPLGRYEAPQRLFGGGNGGSRVIGMRYSIRLAVPPTAGRRLAHVRGQLKLWVAGPDERAEVADVAAAGKGKGKSYPMGRALSLRVSNVTVSDNYIQVQITVPRNGMPQAAWDQARMLLQSSLRVRALNAAGREWGKIEGDLGAQVQNDSLSVWAVVQPDGGGGKPDRLVIEGPVTATEVDVPYDLRDLPLP